MGNSHDIVCGQEGLAVIVAAMGGIQRAWAMGWQAVKNFMGPLG